MRRDEIYDFDDSIPGLPIRAGLCDSCVVISGTIGIFNEIAGFETWYVKVSKTVTSAAILKLLIRPDSSADHPKIMSIQYKTQDHECSNMFS